MDVDSSCTSTSMYLSFDAESTISSSALFKTMETTALSARDASEIANDEHYQVDCENITLEADNSALMASKPAQMQLSMVAVSTSPIHHPFMNNKRSLQQFNALCSTPSKAKLPQHFETAAQKAELAFAQPIYNEQHMGLDMPYLEDIEEEERQKQSESVSNTVKETKENVQAESGEASTLSMSSSVEIVTTTVIEQKLTSLKISDDENTPPILKQIVGGNLKQHVGEKTKNVSGFLSNAGYKKERRSILAPRNVRKSICEPDLKGNKPSRILTNMKTKQSLIAISTASATSNAVDNREDESKIPSLVDRMLEEIVDGTVSDNEINQIVNKKNTDVVKRVVTVASGRTSKLPTKSTTNLGEKRPYSMSHRMSIYVKTTLNSPARKLARRSVLANPPSLRRSSIVLPKKNDETKEDINLGRNTRKIMLPIGRTPHHNNSKPLHEPLTNPSKSLVLSSVATKTNRPELVTTYNCVVCGSKFSLKSLLVAHKRSHEDDDSMPAFVRKQTSSTTKSTVAIANKNAVVNKQETTCKFCDKKFALIRALHIHLMQNCTKIPPSEKRKLQFTELNHVEKAQLPSVFHGNASSISGASLHLQMQKKFNSNVSNGAATSSIESLIDKEKDITVLANELVAAVDGVITKMQPPICTTTKKKGSTKTTTAHAGVYRTPNKCVPCHLCKRTFKNVLEYTNHSMMVHSMPNQS